MKTVTVLMDILGNDCVMQLPIHLSKIWLYMSDGTRQLYTCQRYYKNTDMIKGTPVGVIEYVSKATHTRIFVIHDEITLKITAIKSKDMSDIVLDLATGVGVLYNAAIIALTTLTETSYDYVQVFKIDLITQTLSTQYEYDDNTLANTKLIKLK